MQELQTGVWVGFCAVLTSVSLRIALYAVCHRAAVYSVCCVPQYLCAVYASCHWASVQCIRKLHCMLCNTERQCAVYHVIAAYAM